MPSKQFLAYLVGATMVAGSLYGASAALGGPSTIQVEQTDSVEPVTTPASLIETDPASAQVPADPAIIAAPEAPAYQDYEQDEYEDEDHDEEEEYGADDHDEYPEAEHDEHEEDDDHGAY